MNTEPKVSLTIFVEGSTRHCLGEKDIPFVITKQDLTTQKLPKEIGRKVVKKGTIKTKDYVWENAQIHINIPRCAYDYMVSSEIPAKYPRKAKHWGSLSPKERLHWHMNLISESRGGKNFSYAVIDE